MSGGGVGDGQSPDPRSVVYPAPVARMPSSLSPAIQVADRLEAALVSQGTVERAAGAKAYLKSDLEFLGVDTPTLRREMKALLRAEPGLDRTALVALAEALWRRGIFELQAAAAELLTMRVDLLEPRDLDLLERLIRDSGTWALVDALAPSVAGPLGARGGAPPGDGSYPRLLGGGLRLLDPPGAGAGVGQDRSRSRSSSSARRRSRRASRSPWPTRRRAGIAPPEGGLPAGRRPVPHRLDVAIRPPGPASAPRSPRTGRG